MIYCPRCDKPIATDHHCLSRRHFFGALLGAVGLLACPVPASAVGATLRAGERLTIFSTVDATAAQLEYLRPTLERMFYASIDIVDRFGQVSHVTGPANGLPLFIAARDYMVTAVRTLHSGGTVAQSTALSITRGPR